MNYVESLEGLLSLCEKLYNQLVYIEQNNEFEDEEKDLKQALRKLIIAEAVQKKHIICVTGLQGVGKTSLMQNYYGIDFSKMNISESRGEKIPVMISEKKECTDICFYAIELKKNDENEYSRVRLPISSDDFCEKTKNMSEDSELMYLEMEVPYKYIKNEYCAFLLLPGFEKRLNYWQDLVNFAVETSDVALFVTDYSSFVDKDNQKLMERIKEQYGSHSMICALTHSDQTEKQNISVKSEIKDYFNLKDDQVILTGFYPNDDDKRAKWCEDLTGAIEKYNSDGNAKAVFEMITDVKNQVKDSITSIEEKLEQKRIEINLEKYGIEGELKDFDKAVKRLKKDWSKRLDSLLKSEESESRHAYSENLKKNINDNKFKDFAKKAGRVIFGESDLDIIEKRELIINCLKKDNIPRSTIAIANSFFDEGNSDNIICNYLIEDKTANKTFTIDQKKQNALMNNVNILLRGKDAVDENGNQLSFINIDNTYEMLAEIAVYNYAKCYGKLLRDNCPGVIDNIDTSGPVDLLEKMTDSKKLGIGMFAMAGIDFLPDAKFDALVAMAEALSIPVGAMVGIFSGVMVVASGVTLTRDINNMSRKQLHEAEEAIHSYYQNIYDSTIFDFDEAMSRCRELVAKNLAYIQGADNNHFALINAKSYVAQLKNSINELYQNMRIESKETKVAGLLTD